MQDPFNWTKSDKSYTNN